MQFHPTNQPHAYEKFGIRGSRLSIENIFWCDKPVSVLPEIQFDGDAQGLGFGRMCPQTFVDRNSPH
jgi:hypothetical protein